MSLPSLGSVIVRPRLPSDLQVISLPLVMSDNEQQSDDVDNSRSKSPLNHDSSDARRDRSRSASGSRKGHRRHKSHKRSRRHSRSRSRSRSRASSRGTEKIRHYINESLISALQPLQQQIASLSGAAPSPASSIEYQELRKQQQELAIETKSATLTSSGAQSQYRCLATINLNLNAAVEAIDELLISRPSPDDPVYLALAPIRTKVSAAVDIAAERIDLVFKADLEPKTGWKALSMYEEKKRQSATDPEKHKIWASCLKAANESQKKASRPASQPFRQQPGWNPGRSGYSGAVTLFHLIHFP